MSFSFRPARRENVPLLIGVAGGTGSGKTMSALKLARGLAGDKPFAMIDTESRRALAYADRFQPWEHGELDPPFRPDAYLAAIQAADKAGYGVIVVDSASHEHAGTGGLLEWHDEILDKKAGDDWKKREAYTFTAWVEPKGSHKHFVQQLLQLRAHLILCFRAEEKIDIVKEGGKTVVVPKKTLTGLDGWVPICEKNLPYELTLSFLLTADAPGVPKPIKLNEDHRALVPLDQPLSEEIGVALADWARGSAGRAEPGKEHPSRDDGAPLPPAEQPATTPEPAAPDQDFEGDEPGPALDPVDQAGAVTFDHPRSRYRGKTVAWVATNDDSDPHYLVWYLEKGLDETLKAAITTWLHARKPELLQEKVA